jgi:hypothetical protein
MEEQKCWRLARLISLNLALTFRARVKFVFTLRQAIATWRVGDPAPLLSSVHPLQYA